MTIELSPELERRIQARAALQGVAPEAFVRDLVVAATGTDDGADFVIIHDPRRCGGNPTVGHTRITVHNLVNLARLYNWDLERMRAEEQPLATAAQIAAAIEYYHSHDAEIDAIIAAQTRGYEEGLQEQQLRGPELTGALLASVASTAFSK